MRMRKTIVGPAIAAAALLAATLLAGGGSLSKGDGVAEAAATVAPSNSVRPAISGSAQQGATLTASQGTWTGTSPITYTYQWQRCNSSGVSCADIGGATSATYVLVAADVAQTIAVGVTAANSDGSTTAYSSVVGPIAPLGAAPAVATAPSIAGTAKQGEKLTLNQGAWTGTSPILFGYQWQRCDTSGKSCASISGATATTYVLTDQDVGHTIIVAVMATNAYGAQTGFSGPTGVVTGSLPVASIGPVIAGTAASGQTLTAQNGTWSGAVPITFAYQWQRCDAAGKNCASIAGATGQTYRVTASDTGHSLVVVVTAKNNYGTKTVTSAFRQVVGSSSQAPPSTPAPSGRSVAVSSVSLPNRLVISGVLFTPRVITNATGSFSARFRVSDSSGHPVAGALVYAIGLPYGRVANAPEAQTDGNGYATISFSPTAPLSTRRGYIVFFVRVRKPGGDLLAGVSTRRLVQVTTRG